ncbi:anhydro-N-acetylmuramic acid kinase-like isoform X2 [Littorina saxatilis]|uniref:Anhydro-N-acetylmuramic acid kinase n=1 Tax=Littorina saxatilis TaxID=31220 RepID=A0AAN9B3M3_9CAEN
MSTYTGMGLMSGTSLDGLDMCVVEFTGDENCDIWSYRVLETVTVPYDAEWKERLSNVMTLSGLDLIKLHYDYSHFMGRAITKFMKDKNRTQMDFVSSHGHTVFHKPEEGLTFQLGDGEVMASYLKCPLVTNFRVKDVALGGQGAPLAPSGERFLYSSVGLCLNLGGIANVGSRDGKAWDICACNSVLNKLAKISDPAADFDKNGQLAARGQILPDVLASLENLSYYCQPYPKSLGVEWVNSEVWPILDTNKHNVADLARTFVEHVATRIAEACEEGTKHSGVYDPSNPLASLVLSPGKQHGDSRVLITGGGAHNKFLMKHLKEKLKEKLIEVEETDDEVVDFKEAIVFAYLGLRCLMGKENVFASTTGARENGIAGSIHQPALLNPSATSMHSHFRFLMRRQSSLS